jgi:hypothetical protein
MSAEIIVNRLHRDFNLNSTRQATLDLFRTFMNYAFGKAAEVPEAKQNTLNSYKMFRKCFSIC